MKTPPAPTESSTIPSLNRIMATINKKYGETVLSRLGEMENTVSERISSGIPKLDQAVGGGFPVGRIIELYGLQSSGKSLIAQKIMAEAQVKGRDVIYVDCENSFDPEFAASLGVDTDKMVLMQTGIGEDVFDIIAKLLASEPGVIVIDSVAALVTRAEMEDSVEKAEMASKARLMSKALRKINALNKRTLIVFINQLRQGIATWGPAPKVTTGGMALGFFASIRLEVKKDKNLIREGNQTTGEVIGQIVQYHISKNKTAQPFKDGSFKFIYEGSHIE